jgi:hypothetical protein
VTNMAGDHSSERRGPEVEVRTVMHMQALPVFSKQPSTMKSSA